MVIFHTWEDIDLNAVYRTPWNDHYKIVKFLDSYYWKRTNVKINKVELNQRYDLLTKIEENDRLDAETVLKFREEWGLTANKIFK